MTSWQQQDNRRMLHTVFRIGKLEESKKFYQDALGMKVQRERDVPDQNFYNVFYGFGDEKTNFALELTYNYGQDNYDIGEGFCHFGVAVQDLQQAVSKAKSNNGQVTKELVKEGDQSLAFAKDPTGYEWELVERKQGTKEPLASIALRVSNLDKSVDYYVKALGMQLLGKFDSPSEKFTKAKVGYGPENDSTVIELVYKYGKDTPYEKGNAYAQVAMGTDDVYKTAEEVKKAGFEVVTGPKEVMGGTKIFQTVDPDGYKYAFVDNGDFLKEL